MIGVLVDVISLTTIWWQNRRGSQIQGEKVSFEDSD